MPIKLILSLTFIALSLTACSNGSDANNVSTVTNVKEEPLALGDGKITKFTSTATGVYRNGALVVEENLDSDDIFTESELTLDVNFTRNKITMKMTDTKAKTTDNFNNTELPFLNINDTEFDYNPTSKKFSGTVTNIGGTYKRNMDDIDSATGTLNATYDASANNGKGQFNGGFLLTNAGNTHDVGFGANAITIPFDVIAKFTSTATGIYTNIPLSNSQYAKLAGITASNINTESDITFNVNFTNQQVIMNMENTVAVMPGSQFDKQSLHSLDIVSEKPQLNYNPTDHKITGTVSNKGGTYFDTFTIASASGMVDATYDAAANNGKGQLNGGFTLTSTDDSHIVVFGNTMIMPPADVTAKFTRDANGYYVNMPLAAALGSSDSYVSTTSDLTFDVNFTDNKITMKMENTALASDNTTKLQFLNINDTIFTYNPASKTFGGTVTNAVGTYDGITIASATGNVNAIFDDTADDSKGNFDGGFTLTGSDDYRHIVAFGNATLASPTDEIVEFTSVATGIYTNATLATLAGLSITSIPTSSDLTLNVNFTRSEVKMNMLNTKTTINNEQWNGTALDFLNIIDAELTYDANMKMIQGNNVQNKGGAFSVISLAPATGNISATLNGNESAFDGMFTLTGTNDMHQVGFGADAIAIPADVTAKFTNVVSGVFNNIFTGRLATTAMLTIDVNLTSNQARINIQNTTVTSDGYWKDKSIAMLDVEDTPLTYTASSKMLAGNVTNKGGTFDNLTMLNFTAETGGFNAALNDSNQYYGGYNLMNADTENPHINYTHSISFGEDPNAVKPAVTAIFSGTATGTYTYHNNGGVPFDTTSNLTFNVNFTDNNVIMNMTNTTGTSGLYNNESAYFLDVTEANLTYDANTKMLSGTARNRGSRSSDVTQFFSGTGAVTATLNQADDQFDGSFALQGSDQHTHTVTFGIGKQAETPPSINNITFTGTASGTYKYNSLNFGNIMETTGDLTLNIDFDNNKVVMDMNNTVATSGLDAGASLAFLDVRKAQLTYDGSDGSISGTATNKGGVFKNEFVTFNIDPLLAGTVTAAWDADDKQFAGNFRMGIFGDNNHYVEFGASNEDYIQPLIDDDVEFTGMATGIYKNENLVTEFGLNATDSLPTMSDITLNVNFGTHAVTMNTENTVTTIDGIYNGTSLAALNIANVALDYNPANATINGEATRTAGTITTAGGTVTINEATGFVNANWDNDQQKFKGGFIIIANDDSHQVTFEVLDALLPPINNGGENNGGENNGGDNMPPADEMATFSATATTGSYLRNDLFALNIFGLGTESDVALDVNFTSKEVTMDMTNTRAANLTGAYSSYNGTAMDFLNIENATLTYDDTSKQITGTVTNKGGNFTIGTINETVAPTTSGTVTATLNGAETEFSVDQFEVGNDGSTTGIHTIDAFTATK